MIDKIIGDQCSGCKLCESVCPKKAVCFVTGDDGFWNPSVDYSKCVKCNLCVKKCPVLNSDKFIRNTPISILDAWSSDSRVRHESTSGGIFYMLAENWINSGGFVAGVVYNDDFKGAHYIVSNNLSDIFKMMGSKYFQADTSMVYDKINDLLLKGKKVLFCGCPCQNAALISKNFDQLDNLLCVDFICRGINSPKAFSLFLSEQEKNNKSKAVECHLKYKREGWQSLGTYIRFENGNEYLKNITNDVWVNGFVGGGGNLYMRHSCFSCHFRGKERLTDITIADFWGLKFLNDEDSHEGVSAVMINTKKGKELIGNLIDSGKIVARGRTIDELACGNPALTNDPILLTKGNHFFEIADKNGFTYAVNKLTKKRKIFRTFNTLIFRALHVIHFLLVPNDISKFLFFKLNFFSSNIARKNGGLIFPHKHCVFEFGKGSKIIVNGGSLVLGDNRARGSKSETLIKMGKKAIWECNNGADVYYNVNIEVKHDATLTTNFFSINSNSSIIISTKSTFDNDVQMGRNIIIYDSDFHMMFDKYGEIVNYPKPIFIGSHVWLANNVVVLKGVYIGNDTLVSSYTTIKGEIPPHSVVSNGTKNHTHNFDGDWGRETF